VKESIKFFCPVCKKEFRMWKWKTYSKNKKFYAHTECPVCSSPLVKRIPEKLFRKYKSLPLPEEIRMRMGR